MSHTDRRSQTRAALLAGLDAELRSRPIERVSVEIIASAAGVSVGSLYTHFDGKPRLALALPVERIQNEALALGLGRLTDAPVARVRALGDLLILAAERTPAATQLLRQFPDGYAELIESDDLLSGVAGCVFHALSTLEQDLEQAARDGALFFTTDVADVSTALLATWRGFLEISASASHQSHHERIRSAWASLSGTLLRPG